MFSRVPCLDAAGPRENLQGILCIHGRTKAWEIIYISQVFLYERELNYGMDTFISCRIF